MAVGISARLKETITVCTAIVRWSRGQVAEILALRDELVGRSFDDPGRWWPGQPNVAGGRDRVAGGSWCVTDMATGATALVLNRPQKPTGSPSRGLLPLLAVAHEENWPSQVDVSGMASFTLVLALPGELKRWVFDGSQLSSESLAPGTHMLTSGGDEDGKSSRYLNRFVEEPVSRWSDVIAAEPPDDDPTALVVRRARDGVVYGTVFGQIITKRRGDVTLEWSRTPWLRRSWQIATHL